MSTVSLLLVSTNKYARFIQPMINSVSKYFLTDYQVSIHLFTDSLSQEVPENINIQKHLIPSYGFPKATLYRYKIFASHKQYLLDDYLLYCDIDMCMCNNISNVIFGKGLTAVTHPGFFKSRGWGSQRCDPRSTAYLRPELWDTYFAGGVQGGERDHYLKACEILHQNILQDEANGVLAEWHDETHWNHYLNSIYPGELKILDPSYCMPENEKQRIQWGINDLTPRIIALEKNHKEIRA